jgi:hypothetical protein
MTSEFEEYLKSNNLTLTDIQEGLAELVQLREKIKALEDFQSVKGYMCPSWIQDEVKSILTNGGKCLD